MYMLPYASQSQYYEIGTLEQDMNNAATVFVMQV
jgi:hypothetical protein